MIKITGYKSPGRKPSADKARAMRTPSMNIQNVPTYVQEDKEFYELFLESKKLEGKRDPASQVKFNTCINKMRLRWALLTNNSDDAKADSPKRTEPTWLI